MLKIAFSPIYKYSVPDGHRFPMIKYELLPEQLLYEGTVSESNFFHPKKLTEDEILQTHTPEYWDKLRLQQLSRKEERAIGLPMSAQLIERGRHIAHGTIECALFAQQHGVALNIAGGTHHAFTKRGEGFCLLNDIAIAANYLLENEKASKILVVDLDVHQGNGTAEIFAENENVFTFSMHGEKNYPLKKERSDLDIELPDGCEDDTYLQLLKSHLPELIDSHSPDFIFYQSGVDINSDLVYML